MSIFKMKASSPCRPPRKSEQGFSLIEVAMALLLLGILLTTAIQAYNLFMVNRINTLTSSSTKIVDAALHKYVARYGRYPAPATRNIPMGTVGFGTSEPLPGTGWPACTPTSTAVCRTAVNTYLGQGVLIGDVPFATLGVPYRSVLDGYGNKLTYAVTESMVTGVFNESAGAVEILNDAGVSIYAGTTQRSHYAIISHGRNMRGAYTLNGVMAMACGTAANGTEFENCNGDGRFRSNYNAAAGRATRNHGNGVAYFDDVVTTTNTSSSGLWSVEPSSPNIRTNLGGNVYVGTCPTYPCIPRSRVDINGSVRADTIETVRMCNYGSPGCISSDVSWGAVKPTWGSPTLIGGTPPPPGPTPKWNATREAHDGAGVRCNYDRGLQGINNYDESCADTAYFDASVNIGSCTTGMYPTGLDAAGKLVCVTP